MTRLRQSASGVVSAICFCAASVVAYGQNVSSAAAGPSTYLQAFGDSIKRTQASVVRLSSPESIEAGFAASPSVHSGDGVDATLGSGAIVSSDGYILTIASLVVHADPLWVTLADGRRFEGKLAAIDRPTDLALVRIQAENLAAFSVPHANHLPMEFVAVLSGGENHDRNQLLGMVVPANRLGRSLPDVGYWPIYAGVVAAQHADSVGRLTLGRAQWNIAFDPQNIGGPLVDEKGDLVGILAKVTDIHDMPVALSVPVYGPNESSVEQFLHTGTISHGKLGVGCEDIPSSILALLGVPPGAVFVASVEPGSAAAAAQVHSGDFITQFAGVPLNGVTDFLTKMARTLPGQDLRLRVARGQSVLSLDAVLGRRDADPVDLTTEKSEASSPNPKAISFPAEMNIASAQNRWPPEGRSMTADWIHASDFTKQGVEAGVNAGIHIEVNDDAPAASDPSAEGRPAVVRSVSPAQGAGSALAAGDQILQINFDRVSGAAQARELLARAQNATAVYLVVRRGDKLI